MEEQTRKRWRTYAEAMAAAFALIILVVGITATWAYHVVATRDTVAALEEQIENLIEDSNRLHMRMARLEALYAPHLIERHTAEIMKRRAQQPTLAPPEDVYLEAKAWAAEKGHRTIHVQS